MHKYRWLVAFGITLATSIALISFLFSNYPTSGSFAYRLLDGFIGNTVSGTILSIMFPFLTLHLGQQTEETVKISADILIKQAERIEIERKLARFEEFMKNESYYNVRFPIFVEPKQTFPEPTRHQSN